MINQDFIEFQDIMFYKHPKYKKYLASKCGKILSLKRKEKKILKLNINCWGYYYFNLYKNGIKSYTVHRFVYETFNGVIPKGMETDHVDGDKKIIQSPTSNFYQKKKILENQNVKKSFLII